MKRLAIVAAMPLLLGLMFLVPPVGEGQDKDRDKDKDPPAAAAPAQPDDDDLQPDLTQLLADPSFDRYADLRRIPNAVDNKNAAELADIALQLAEGERVLHRPHNLTTSASVFNLAIKIAVETQDKATLARLAKAVEKSGDQDRINKVALAQQLAGKARSVDPVLKTGTPEVIAAIDARLEAIQKAREEGDLETLDNLEEDLADLQIDDKQRGALKKLITEARNAPPMDTEAAALVDLATMLSGGSRSGTGDYYFYWNPPNDPGRAMVKKSFATLAEAERAFRALPVRDRGPRVEREIPPTPPTIFILKGFPLKTYPSVDASRFTVPQGVRVVPGIVAGGGGNIVAGGGGNIVAAGGGNFSLIGNDGAGITNPSTVDALKKIISGNGIVAVPGLIGDGGGTLQAISPQALQAAFNKIVAGGGGNIVAAGGGNIVAGGGGNLTSLFGLRSTVGGKNTMVNSYKFTPTTLKVDPKKVEFDRLLTQGSTAMVAKKYADAKTQFTAALKIYPTDAAATRLLQDANKALSTPPPPKVDPKKVEFDRLLTQGSTAMGAKKFTEAKTHFTAALKIFPSDATANRLLQDANQAYFSSLPVPPPSQVVPLIAGGSGPSRYTNVHLYEDVLRGKDPNGRTATVEYRVSTFASRYPDAMFATSRTGYVFYVISGARKTGSRTMVCSSKLFDCDKKEKLPPVQKLLDDRRYMDDDQKAMLEFFACPRQGEPRAGMGLGGEALAAYQSAINKYVANPRPDARVGWDRHYVQIGPLDYAVRASIQEDTRRKRCQVNFFIVYTGTKHYPTN